MTTMFSQTSLSLIIFVLQEWVNPDSLLKPQNPSLLGIVFKGARMECQKFSSPKGTQT